jgi:hypothetical protein
MSSKPVGALEAAAAAISTLAWPEPAKAPSAQGHDGASGDMTLSAAGPAAVSLTGSVRSCRAWGGAPAR